MAEGCCQQFMIRSANVSDIPQIDALDPFAGDRAREIAEHRLFVIEKANAIVGYVSWQRAGFVGRDYITFLFVREDHRRCGLATALLDAGQRAIGIGRLFISTEADNQAMLALLPRQGWTHAGAVEGTNENSQAEVFFYKDL